MLEINLPTKSTQDSIKSDTTEILGNFPISGGGIKSVQRGLTAHGPTSTVNVSITPVNMSKTFVNITPVGIANRTNATGSVSGRLVNSNTLALYGTTNSNIHTAWEVIEFN